MLSHSIIQDANQIIKASIEAVLPDAVVERALSRHDVSRPVTIVSLGKAGWRMADAAYRVLGEAGNRGDEVQSLRGTDRLSGTMRERPSCAG